MLIYANLHTFCLKLKLGDAALKIDVNPSAVNLPSSPPTHVYSCLQGHITKLQVITLEAFQEFI